MAKINKHIEIVRTARVRLSSMGQESCDSIFAVLDKHYAKVGVTMVNSPADLESLAAKRPDLVFLGMKSILYDDTSNDGRGDRIWIADYLDRRGIDYTGSGRLAHELELDKASAKRRVSQAGLKTSPHRVIKLNQLQGSSLQSQAFPLFVKPNNSGGGAGIDSDSVVHNSNQLRAKAKSISERFRADVLVEDYLPGREFSVAVLKDELSADLMILPVELVAQPDKNGDRLLSQAVKSSNTEQAIEVFDKHLEFKVKELAAGVFTVLGARDYGRIDIRLDKAGAPNFLEANLLPSLVDGYGSFPKACLLKLGLAYEPMILSIVSLALSRSEKMQELVPELDLNLPMLPSFETRAAII